MLSLRTTAILFSITFVMGAMAQAPEPFTPPADPDRYWIIADKTIASEPFRSAIGQTVFDLVYQGAGGEIQDGSVIEVWTFGDNTEIRGFVPEMLTPNNHLEIARKAANHLRQMDPRGVGDMEKFAEHFRSMASLVFETTIFFVSAPTTRLKGTSVDDEINAIFDVHEARMTQEGKPFITTFRVQDGKLADFSVSESALAMAIPPMPQSQVSPEEKARMIEEARAAIDAREQARLEAIAAEVKAKMEAEEAARRQAEKERLKPDEEREGAIILRGNPKPENVTVAHVDSDAVTSKPAANTTVSTPAEEAPVTPTPVSQPPKASIVSNGPVARVESGSTEPVIVSQSMAGEKASVGSGDGIDDGSPVAEKVSTSAVMVATEVVEEPDPQAEPAEAPASDPAQFAVQPQTWVTAGGLFVAGVAFFVVAGVLVWIAVRRTRTVSGPSIITQSMRSKRIDRS